MAERPEGVDRSEPTASPSPAALSLLADNNLDHDRLADILAGAGFDAELLGIDAELVGTGQVGENVRCRLHWDGGSASGRATADGPPDSVILKLPSSDPVSRATGGATRSYIREVGFYRDVAPEVEIRVPAIHHLWEDQDTNRFLLVMEDIHPAATGDQLAGCTLTQAGLAVDAAAALHRSTWHADPEHRYGFEQLDWVDVPSPERTAERAELFAVLYPGFVDRYRDRLSAEDLAFGDWLAEHYPAWQACRADTQCLVHGDFRLDNVLFGQAAPAPAMTTVDWQTVSLGPAVTDVAYFLSGALDPETLAANENELLARYRSGLAEGGIVVDQGWVDREYALGAPAGYVMAVIASQIVGQTERGDAMFLVMAAGSASLARRLDVADRLG